jgi:membrane-bound lytic murein transglycosylase D
MQPTQPRQVSESTFWWGNHRGVWKFIAALGLLALTQALSFHETSPSSKVPDHKQTLRLQAVSLQPVVASDYAFNQRHDFSVLLQQTLPKFDIDPGRVPAFFQQKVRERLHDYTVLHRKQTQAMLRRGAPYLPLIKRILRQYNLPVYFAYIPLAESAFHADAAHPGSGARGLWQLMPNTARAYGLKVSATVDERLDPFMATRAAARYLRELQDMFGQNAPLLILAAYNFGENNLSKAIVRSRTRDIWRLFRKRQIPPQTREYLVKMVTLWIIITHTDYYGFSSLADAAPQVTPFSEVTFPHPVSLEILAQQIALPVEQVRSMNPHLLSTQVPAHTPIRIPASSVYDFLHFEVRLTPSLSTERCCARLMVVDTCWHTVEEGETAFAIARRYAISLTTLKLLNQLQGPNPIIRPGQRLLVCQVPSPKIASGPPFW